MSNDSASPTTISSNADQQSLATSGQGHPESQARENEGNSSDTSDGCSVTGELNPLETRAARGSAKNALKHGAFARDILPPGTVSNEFESELARIWEELQPEGPCEEAAVIDIAQLWFCRRGVIKHFARSSVMHSAANDLVPMDIKSFDISPADRSDAIRKLDELAGAVGLHEPTFTEALSRKGELSPDQQRVLSTIFHLAFPGKPAEHTGDDAVFETTARFTKCLASIDTRIEKAMQRLIGFKEYKRQYCKLKLETAA